MPEPHPPFALSLSKGVPERQEAEARAPDPFALSLSKGLPERHQYSVSTAASNR
jgi:hypothetical protein